MRWIIHGLDILKEVTVKKWVVLVYTILKLFLSRRFRCLRDWTDLLNLKKNTNVLRIQVLILLVNIGKDVLDKFSTLRTQRISDKLQKLEPSDRSRLISECFFKNLKLMFFEKESVFSKRLHIFLLIPFRNVEWRWIH